jgi:hypothetical protein
MKISSILLLFLICGCSGDRKLKQGSNLFMNKDVVVRVDCNDKLCIDRKESTFSMPTLTSLLMRRFDFEILTIDKLLVDNREDLNLISKRESLVVYTKSDLPSKVKDELENKNDFEFRSYIFAATDSLE